MRIERSNRIKCELDVDVVGQQVRFRPVHILCVLFNTYTRTHTHTHAKREKERQVRCVVCRLFHFFDGSFALPSSFFGCPPPPNPTQSFLFFSFHFALRCEPSLTLKLTHPENVKSVSAFFVFRVLFRFFLLSFFLVTSSMTS